MNFDPSRRHACSLIGSIELGRDTTLRRECIEGSRALRFVPLEISVVLSPEWRQMLDYPAVAKRTSSKPALSPKRARPLRPSDSPPQGPPQTNFRYPPRIMERPVRTSLIVTSRMEAVFQGSRSIEAAPKICAAIVR